MNLHCSAAVGVPTTFETNILVFLIVILNITGFFGHINLLYASYRRTELQSKYALLLASLSPPQMICLFSELIYAFTLVYYPKMPAWMCSRLLSGYTACNIMHRSLMMAVAGDMLLSIAAPFWHRQKDTGPYLKIFILPSVVVGFAFGVFDVVTQFQDETLVACNPPIAMGELGRQLHYPYAAVLLVLTLPIFSLVCFNENFIVMFWRSEEHRKAFKAQIRKLIGIFSCRTVLLLVGVCYAAHSTAEDGSGAPHENGGRTHVNHDQPLGQDDKDVFSTGRPETTTVTTSTTTTTPASTTTTTRKTCTWLSKCSGDEECGGTGKCLGLNVGKCNCDGCINFLSCKDDSACGGLIGACNKKTKTCDCYDAYRRHGYPLFLDALRELCNVKPCTTSNATSVCHGFSCHQGTCFC
ncbi:unnamed protein product [Caenorhabditis auriculariae]|uniref:G-protein coupled receptors family 1 profile domain-containing protein n=1 Tax=Caenorhabditis auriculariae TaxID=2777116 RepID=A0A8S1GTL4_9PELO|nr:unnamed protein product [Caenorhabditis auriculariae]